MKLTPFVSRGGELFQYLKKEKRFSEARARFYVAQIALGLAHLHESNIIHRDMKPENVLMDEHGDVYLADFGMAKVVKGDTPAISFVGTREYLGIFMQNEFNYNPLSC